MSTAMRRSAPRSSPPERRQADAAEADHGDARAGEDLRRLHGGADARRDAASEEACAIERSRRHRNRLRGVYHDMGGQRPACEDAGERRTVACPSDARRLGPRVGAAPRLVPSGWRRCRTDRPGDHDGIADGQVIDPRTEGLDHTGALVSEQHRQRRTPVAVLARPEIRCDRRRSPRSGPAPRRVRDRRPRSARRRSRRPTCRRRRRSVPATPRPPVGARGSRPPRVDAGTLLDPTGPPRGQQTGRGRATSRRPCRTSLGRRRSRARSGTGNGSGTRPGPGT